MQGIGAPTGLGRSLSPHHQRIMGRYKKGDKVICMDANMGGGTPELIHGKTYEILKDDNIASCVYVTNEQGKEMTYSHTRFMPAPDHVHLPKTIARMQMFHLALALKIGCEVFDVGDNYIFCRFVSDQFKGVSLARRYLVIDEMMQRKCKRVLEDYHIFYEAFTKDEVNLLGVHQ
jgi:hypothetical protein